MTNNEDYRPDYSRQYIAIDLKSFYASVECVERGFDPLDTCLVVADRSRTEKTICLAVSPALKAYGTGGRPRLFEVVQKIRDANRRRGRMGTSCSARQLVAHPELGIDFIVAQPRMALYIQYSTRIYSIYLRYVAPEDIHVYSIDEVFIDATSYLSAHGMDASRMARIMISDVLAETGITATAGIGTNLYLCKVAMDIVAKKMEPDVNGVRIAALDEMSYRRRLWHHKPLTDFWRVGHGIADRLALYGIHTMGDIARCSLRHEDFLYSLFGINAELLIDHAWGWEPVTMALIKSYRPETKSISSGQVLKCPYTPFQARNVALEMADNIALELLEKRLMTDQVVLTIGYDSESLRDPEVQKNYRGRISHDFYGRPVPEHGHGTATFAHHTSSASYIIARVEQLYDRVVNTDLLVRRLTLAFNHLLDEEQVKAHPRFAELNLFMDFDEQERRLREEKDFLEKERRRQEAVLKIKKRFGKNAILRGLNFADGSTQIERNTQIGGHHE